MAEFHEQLKKAMQLRNMSQGELSKRTGIPKSAMSQYMSGKFRPKQTRTFLIAEALRVNESWLMGFEQEPMDKKPLPQNLIPLKKIRFVPILGQIACGKPILAEQNYEGTVMVPEHVNATFALRCKGDSMIDANIQNGDIVFIQETPVVENGEIAAVVIGDEATLKKVYYQDDTVTLLPANSAYEPFVFKKEEINDIRICGKAVAVLRYIQ